MTVRIFRPTTYFITCFLLVNLGCKNKTDCLPESDSGVLNHTQLIESEGLSNEWRDDFDSLNPDNWTIGLIDSASNHLMPGAVGQYLLNHFYDSYITEEDVLCENGSLKLLSQRREYQGDSPAGQYHYTSGWVMSMHKVHMNTGYIEMRAKFPKGDKVWPAFWLIPEDLSWCPEWDIFEYFGYREDEGYDQMGMHLCYDPWPNEEWSECFRSGFDLEYSNTEWHTFGFIWTEEYAAWFVDGEMLRLLCANEISGWPNKEMYIVLNNATRTASPDNATVWPTTFEIDYLKILSN